jgi:replication factor C small subunit
MSIENFLWVERYRPKTIDECILSDSVKNTFKDFIKTGEIPHLLLSGSAGVGKTTLGRALASELNADLLYVNASNENNVETIRNKVTQFASTVSFEGNLKIVLLDEGDGLSSNGAGGAGAQGILRATMEEFHHSTRFIITCNFPQKLIAPIHSRCTHFNFKTDNKEKPAIAAAFFKRVCDILEAEKVKFDKKVVAALVQKYFPDFRKTLNELQRYSASGEIDSGILVDSNTTFEELIKHIKDKKFGEIRKWAARNNDMDPSSLFRYFYDNVGNLVDGPNIPEIILLIAQYQDMSSRVVDQEINSMAFLIEILSAAKWK